MRVGSTSQHPLCSFAGGNALVSCSKPATGWSGFTATLTALATLCGVNNSYTSTIQPARVTVSGPTNVDVCILHSDVTLAYVVTGISGGPVNINTTILPDTVTCSTPDASGELSNSPNILCN